MSQTLACPFCGAMMEAPLRFCQECGRAVTPEDMARAGLKLRGSGDGTVSSSRQFALAKRDHTGTRQVRSIMWSISWVLMLVILYYGIMKYVLHEHMPGNLDVKLEMLARGETVDWSDWSTPSKTQPQGPTDNQTPAETPSRSAP